MTCSKFAQRKCLCCKEFFAPDYRNAHHQFYCSKSDCHLASKAASQRRWLRKPANRDYFRAKDNVERVRLWRKAHPGFWKKRSARSNRTEVVAPEPLDPGSPLVTPPRPGAGTLQDFCLPQHPVFIGLISMVTGSTLQEDIASTARKLEAKGRDILGLAAPAPFRNLYDCQTPDST